jgi:hypothetical protein
MAVRSVSGLCEAVLVATAGVGTLTGVGVANASSVIFISAGVGGTRIALDNVEITGI